MLESQVRMFQSQAAARRADLNPMLAATASYNYAVLHNNPRVWEAQDNQNIMLGLNISLPLFDGGSARANATMERMAAISAEQDLRKSRRMRSNEYHEALVTHERLRTTLDKLSTAHDLAEKTAQISMDRFVSGQTSAVELSDVQAAVMQMDMAILNTKFSILMTEEDIKRLGGV